VSFSNATAEMKILKKASNNEPVRDQAITAVAVAR